MALYAVLAAENKDDARYWEPYTRRLVSAGVVPTTPASLDIGASELTTTILANIISGWCLRSDDAVAQLVQQL